MVVDPPHTNQYRSIRDLILFPVMQGAMTRDLKILGWALFSHAGGGGAVTGDNELGIVSPCCSRDAVACLSMREP